MSGFSFTRGFSVRGFADLKVPSAAVGWLLDLAAERGREPAYARRMVESRRLSNRGPPGLLVRDQPTLRQALEALVQHIHLHSEALSVQIEPVGHRVVSRAGLPFEGAASQRRAAERVLAPAALRRQRARPRIRSRPISVRAAKPAPA